MLRQRQCNVSVMLVNYVGVMSERMSLSVG